MAADLKVGRGHHGLKADTGQAQGGQGEHMADATRSHGGHRTPQTVWGMKENNYTSVDLKQLFKHRARLHGPILGAKMNAKETDQQACNINVAGCAMLRKTFFFMMPRPCPTTGHERTKSTGEGTAWTRAGKADIPDTRGAHRADKVWRRGQSGLKRHKANTWPTEGGHIADICGQVLEARPKRTPCRHMADTMADKVWRRGQSRIKADTTRTMADKADNGGQGLEARAKRS